MATFDFDRLRLDQYDLPDAIEAMKYQEMVEEFMEVVRKNPSVLIDKEAEVDLFCAGVDTYGTWPLASNMVPEFRYSQNHDTNEATLMNQILRKLKHRRPRPPLAEQLEEDERTWLKQSIRNSIAYVELDGRRGHSVTEEERRRIDDLTERAFKIIEAGHKKKDSK